jgi:hypothetical protein
MRERLLERNNMKRFKVEASRLLNEDEITVNRSIEDAEDVPCGFTPKTVIQLIIIVVAIVSAFFTAQVIARDYTDTKFDKLQTSQDVKIDKILQKTELIQTGMIRLETAFSNHVQREQK